MAKEDLKYDSKIRARIIISGRVQGVMFRDSMKRKADKLGVCGWVRNIPNRRVEAVLEGDKLNVLDLIEWAHKGSFLARVDEVKIFWDDYKKEFNDFIIS